MNSITVTAVSKTNKGHRVELSNGDSFNVGAAFTHIVLFQSGGWNPNTKANDLHCVSRHKSANAAAKAALDNFNVANNGGVGAVVELAELVAVAELDAHVCEGDRCCGVVSDTGWRKADGSPVHPEFIGTAAADCARCFDATYGVALDCAVENMQDAGHDVDDAELAASWAREYVSSGTVSAYYCVTHDPINAPAELPAEPTSFAAQTRRNADAAWVTVGTDAVARTAADKLRDEMERNGFRHGELTAHVADLADGHTLHADNGRQFRLADAELVEQAPADDVMRLVDTYAAAYAAHHAAVQAYAADRAAYGPIAELAVVVKHAKAQLRGAVELVASV